jgi:broad specificity phosphatase PhoE
MSTTLYLIRHVQIAPSESIPHSQWPPSETGKAQAVALGNILSGLKIDKLFSSPYHRCLETIRHFVERSKLEPILNEGLRERSFGDGFAHMKSTEIWDDPGPTLILRHLVGKLQPRPRKEWLKPC